MKIGNILTKLRKNKGYTQEQVAEEHYMTRTAYAKWESTKVMLNLAQLQKLSNLYSIKIYWAFIKHPVFKSLHMRLYFFKVLMFLTSLLFSNFLLAQVEYKEKRKESNVQLSIEVKSNADKDRIFMDQQYDRFALTNSNLNENFRHQRKEPDSNHSDFVFSVEEPTIIIFNFKPIYVELNNHVSMSYTYKGQNENQAPIESFLIKGNEGVFLIENSNLYESDILKARKYIADEIIKKRIDGTRIFNLLDSFANSRLIGIIKRYPNYDFTDRRRKIFRDYFLESYYNNLIIALRNSQERFSGLEERIILLNKKISSIDILKGNQFFFAQKNIYKFLYQKKWRESNFNLDIITTDLGGYDTLTCQYLLLMILKNDFGSINSDQSKVKIIRNIITNDNLKKFAYDYQNSTPDKGTGYLSKEERGVLVYDSKLKEIKFEDIFKKTEQPYLYFDFCGSWCPPCIKEIDQYASSPKLLDNSGKIRPIWLFFENNKKSWLMVIEKYHLKKENCFLILDSKLQYLFGKNFEWMGEFPHHFVFSRAGEIINPSAPALIDFKENDLPLQKGPIPPPSF